MAVGGQIAVDDIHLPDATGPADQPQQMRWLGLVLPGVVAG